ncbi:MAG: hypothetical protein CM1200mP9_04720 [Gammaproteobacteria bacterium]|nr:MAG: hypothetical protein CM1200mP9_04720 [Gammaproteobacteria bacterium]
MNYRQPAFLPGRCLTVLTYSTMSTLPREGFLGSRPSRFGVKHYPNQPYRFRHSEPEPNERAPLLGEHAEDVLTRLAGLSSEEVVELLIDDVVGTVPMAAR